MRTPTRSWLAVSKSTRPKTNFPSSATCGGLPLTLREASRVRTSSAIYAMSGNPRVIGWDTGILLALLTGGSGANPTDMAGIREHIRQIEDKHLTLVMSVLTYTEILNSRLPTGAVDRLEQIF